MKHARPRKSRLPGLRLILLAIFAVSVAGGCIEAGLWQLRRLKQRVARNELIAKRREAPAVSISTLTRDDTAAIHWRRVSVRGVADYSAEMLHAMRSQNGAPGVYLLTPVRILDGAWGDTAVLLLRGFIAAADGRTIDANAARETDTLSVEALVTSFPPPRGGNVRMPSAANTVRDLNRDTKAAKMGRPLAPFALLVLGDTVVRDVTLPARIPPPTLDEGSHRSYAVQWFSFAAIAIGGFVVLAINDRKVRSDGAIMSGDES